MRRRSYPPASKATARVLSAELTETERETSSATAVVTVGSEVRKRCPCGVGNCLVLTANTERNPLRKCPFHKGLYAETVATSQTQVAIENKASTEVVRTSEPAYITLWNRTKRHPDGFDEEGEAKLKAFQELHMKQIAEKGVDNLTVEEAYQQVLGFRSGYAGGLGKEHRVLSMDGQKTKAQIQSEIEQLTQRQSEMQTQIRRLQQEALERDKKREEEARAMEFRLREEMNSKFEDMIRQLRR